MSPLRLSDAELDQLYAAARPLDVRVRDALLKSVADALKGCGEIGPGVLHRVVVTEQQRFLKSAELDLGMTRQSKYR
jgi:hypothetical protein